jgi:hypothetical protein
MIACVKYFTWHYTPRNRPKPNPCPCLFYSLNFRIGEDLGEIVIMQSIFSVASRHGTVPEEFGARGATVR